MKIKKTYLVKTKNWPTFNFLDRRRMFDCLTHTNEIYIRIVDFVNRLTYVDQSSL